MKCLQQGLTYWSQDNHYNHCENVAYGFFFSYRESSDLRYCRNIVGDICSSARETYRECRMSVKLRRKQTKKKYYELPQDAAVKYLHDFLLLTQIANHSKQEWVRIHTFEYKSVILKNTITIWLVPQCFSELNHKILYLYMHCNSICLNRESILNPIT